VSTVYTNRKGRRERSDGEDWAKRAKGGGLGLFSCRAGVLGNTFRTPAMARTVDTCRVAAAKRKFEGSFSPNRSAAAKMRFASQGRLIVLAALGMLGCVT
jgi:hypothetical protein